MRKSVSKGDKGEQLVNEILTNINDEQYLINNLILLGDNDVSHQYDHILIRHNGIFVIETKNYYGDISGDIEDIYWTKSYFVKGRLHKDKFMNPIKQNNAHIRFLKKILGRDLPYINIVVFINNDVSKLGISNVVNEQNLVNRIINTISSTTLSSTSMKNINDTLLRLEADIQSEDHVNNIKEIKKVRRDIRKESILVMEKGICPICGNNIKMNKNIYYCERCHYKLVV